MLFILCLLIVEMLYFHMYFQGQLQSIPKPVSNQNYFSTLCLKNEVKRSNHSIKTFHMKKLSNLISWENFGVPLKGQTVKLIEMTESICCFYRWLPIYKKSVSQLNSVLKYCGFNNGNYSKHAQVCLTTSIRTNWIKEMYLWKT